MLCCVFVVVFGVLFGFLVCGFCGLLFNYYFFCLGWGVGLTIIITTIINALPYSGSYIILNY